MGPKNGLTRLQWIALGLILAVAALTRAAFLLTTEPAAFTPDEVGYTDMARQFLSTGVLGYKSTMPNAFVTPGYPLFLSLLYRLSDMTGLALVDLVRWVQALLSVAGVALIFAIGRRLGSNFIAFGAASVAAVYKQLIYANVRVLTEVLYTFLLLLYTYTVLGWMKKSRLAAHALSGAVFAVTVLVRPAVLPIFIFPYIFALWENRRQGSQLISLAGGFLVALLCFSAVMSPWWVRNYVSLGQVILTATQTGDPVLRGSDPYDPYDHKGKSIMAGVPQEKMVATAVARVKDGLKEDPALWLKWYTVGKLSWLWGAPWPFAPPLVLSRWLHYFFVFSGFLGAFLALGRPLFRWPAAIVIFFTLLQLAFIPIPRYMFPLAPFMLLLTAFFWQEAGQFLNFLRQKRKNSWNH